MARGKAKRIGDVLLEAELITKEQLDEALTEQRGSGKKLGEILVELGYVTEQQVFRVLEYQYHIPYIDLAETKIDKDVPLLIGEKLARKYRLIPIKKEERLLTVCMTDPLDFYAIDDVRLATGLEVKAAMSGAADIMLAIDRYYGNEGAEQAAEELTQEYLLDSIEGLSKLSENEVNNAPVVRLVNSIIQHAVKTGASDIHIEPMETEMRVRFRVDGELREILRSSKGAHAAVITRIKILGKMDIGEKRLPQDGGMEMEVGGVNVDLRLSVLPTVHGEKVVIRILGYGAGDYSKEQLGFTAENLVLFDKIMQNPNGLILVSGPTGSGKTTTLYTMLKELNRPGVNVITVEDPVEYRIAGVNQVQVNNKTGLTFASGLRSILRQDPDIVMVGEIRDSETAQIAIRASITGHIVLSTIHTNDSASTVARLVDMDVEPYLVSTALVGVIAQRLVRRICPKCKESYRPEHSELMILKLNEPQPLFRGKGCPACNYTGYSKRIAIHEILAVTHEIRDMIERRATADQIRRIAMRLGTTTLRDNCTKLVLEGVTTVDELIKVTYSME